MVKKTRGGTLLSQVHQVCGRVWNKILRENDMADLEGARGRIIFALWGKDGVPIKTLCEKTSLDKSTLTGIIDRLERDGYVERKSSETDKRSTLISLTGKEQEFAKIIQKVSTQMNKIFYKGFSDDEIIQFEEMLARILENCKEAE
ncbi:DNA-binding transcriptional regulator, MarR family [Treponema bryantii]|uniref:DNA-binding transcriptional regulator, MarR family n=1 Tax=Treponema bryantii TaxID=163 RepID=A0A1H9CY54_9SPIR|nr:MarR family transcriptional regulator [Treponema bryantii]SEQ06186.1 DNA-binding transcriptional regulator, MarR family [Treponema bryantii]